MEKRFSTEQTLYRIAKEFKEKTGVDIYQSQLTELFAKERTDLNQKTLTQYVAIYVDALQAQGLIEKTTKFSRTNLVVK